MSVLVDDISALDLSAVDVSSVLSAASKSLSDGNGKISINPESVERDLAKLVLVVVELLRRLMEHQALARMDRGTLSEDEINALSDGLYRAKSKIEEMRETFGILEEDFNIELGPLGKIL